MHETSWPMPRKFAEKLGLLWPNLVVTSWHDIMLTQAQDGAEQEDKQVRNRWGKVVRRWVINDVFSVSHWLHAWEHCTRLQFTKKTFGSAPGAIAFKSCVHVCLSNCNSLAVAYMFLQRACCPQGCIYVQALEQCTEPFLKPSLSPRLFKLNSSCST